MLADFLFFQQEYKGNRSGVAGKHADYGCAVWRRPAAGGDEKNEGVIVMMLSFLCTPNRAVLEPILADLNRIWELRHWIPNPGEPILPRDIQIIVN